MYKIAHYYIDGPINNRLYDIICISLLFFCIFTFFYTTHYHFYALFQHIKFKIEAFLFCVF